MSKSFSVTHHYHTNKARLETGEVVHRRETLFVSNWQVEVPCVPYDDHFIYHTTRLGPAYKCTCGAVAIIALVAGRLQFACLHHMNYGKHTTGGERWV